MLCTKIAPDCSFANSVFIRDFIVYPLSTESSTYYNLRQGTHDIQASNGGDPRAVQRHPCENVRKREAPGDEGSYSKKAPFYDIVSDVVVLVNQRSAAVTLNS
uniref:Uncharacterized protein n=1 Tax=Steinernema glaseri TaxID=37863 RepID=A0A1I8ATL7_9BILA